jgi:hypothetical protein
VQGIRIFPAACHTNDIGIGQSILVYLQRRCVVRVATSIDWHVNYLPCGGVQHQGIRVGIVVTADSQTINRPLRPRAVGLRRLPLRAVIQVAGVHVSVCLNMHKNGVRVHELGPAVNMLNVVAGRVVGGQVRVAAVIRLAGSRT